MNSPTKIMTSTPAGRIFHFKGWYLLCCCWLLAAGIARCQPFTNGVVAVNTLDGSTIGVYFFQPVDPVSAVQTLNYLVYGKGGSGLVTVTNVVLQNDDQSVELYLSAPVGQFFAVGVSNVFTLDGTSVFNTTATGYASADTGASIGTVADPKPVGQVFTALPTTFTVTASGSGIGGTNDHCQFVYQSVIGDFDMSVQVTSLDSSSPNAMAGLMARNSLDPASPMALLNFTPAQGSDGIQTSGRSAMYAPASLFTATGGADSFQWLRINRTGSTMQAYFGTNGVDWITISNAFPLVLSSNLYVGLTLTSGTNGRTTTASFTSLGVQGTHPGDNIIPTVSTAVFEKTNLVVRWPVTPEDFTVLIATNLANSGSYTNTPGGLTNNSTQWALVGLPVQDSSLTGTNAAMPGLGRYMIIPRNILGNIPLFIRLEEVARVIPDPPLGVTAGIILSVGKANLTSSTIPVMLCSLKVIGTNAVATKVGYPLLCLAGINYTFTTAPNAPSPVVVIQVTSISVNGATIICGSPIANSSEYQVTVTPTSTPTYCTFVAAPGTPVNANCPIQVQINMH